MKIKRLKRKLKARPGGSLEPVGSEIGGEIVIATYGLEKLERELSDAAERIQRTRKWLETVRGRISPNDQHQRWDPAAADNRIASDLNGWLPSAECCG